MLTKMSTVWLITAFNFRKTFLYLKHYLARKRIIISVYEKPVNIIYLVVEQRTKSHDH